MTDQTRCLEESMSKIQFTEQQKRERGLCSAKDCNRPAKSRGMCKKHYQRWWSKDTKKRHGMTMKDWDLHTSGLEKAHVIAATVGPQDERGEMPNFDEALDQLFALCLRLNQSSKEDALKEMRQHYVLDTLKELDILHDPS